MKPKLRIRQAAAVLGVSDDTIRRWIDGGQLTAVTDDTGRRAVDGGELARRAREIAAESPIRELDQTPGRQSLRNHLTGIVTAITVDKVMAQVDIQAGPFRVVSLISAEAVRELELEVGSLATAVVKATNVSVERTLS
ncbi:MAG TPA: TOBE domain-containing protein [Actinomycetaceae bacterium]|nr:TOBE domain-containing protein [Actinomycetaceae bacterium]